MKNRYEIKNMTTIIYVRRKGREFKVYIDTEDLSRVSNFNGTWHLDNRGYIKRTLKSKTELMHRIIMEPPEDMVVDHIDGNQLNNKKKQPEDSETFA